MKGCRELRANWLRGTWARTLAGNVSDWFIARGQWLMIGQYPWEEWLGKRRVRQIEAHTAGWEIVQVVRVRQMCIYSMQGYGGLTAIMLFTPCSLNWSHANHQNVKFGSSEAFSERILPLLFKLQLYTVQRLKTQCHTAVEKQILLKDNVQWLVNIGKILD